MRRRGLTLFDDQKSAAASVPNGFHIATLFQVLEHLDHPMETLLSIRELMVPHGILILEVPNCEGTVGIKNINDYRLVDPLEHINAFTPQSLTQFAARAGFRRIRTPIVQVTSSFKRVLKREARRIASIIRKPDTNQYFQKVEAVY